MLDIPIKKTALFILWIVRIPSLPGRWQGATAKAQDWLVDVKPRKGIVAHLDNVNLLYCIIKRNTLDKLLGLCKIKIEKVLPIDG